MSYIDKFLKDNELELFIEYHKDSTPAYIVVIKQEINGHVQSGVYRERFFTFDEAVRGVRKYVKLRIAK